MPELSVTIITCNEEHQIAEAIASASWADEVLVIDSESSDHTAEIAAQAGARVVVTDWPGFGAQKNRAAELAKNSWILSLDADERVSPELAAAIRNLPPTPPHAAYRLRRRNRFAGKTIRQWPWSWDMTTRLYDRRQARFSERLVHETLRCGGTLGELAGWLEHFSYSDWDDYRRRQHSYAALGAAEAADRGRRPRPGDLTLRPAVTFLRHWLGRGFLLGGVLGWRLSLAAARGTRLKYLKLREMDSRVQTRPVRKGE